ncbi:DUF3108 domain-containing protein [Pseudoruegeria sp. SK021]|uniref:DUF3108 domain-containing protein n=1 Tax=Pseudoruegeria sp. SK021 TaxID=1933035 RepID=UPI000A229F66|nr:DUF3108 domain-containing protein [Pseudoruegeria sp. SK021]OSP55692.1 hypothetical protein BV911_06180 [Pseudoruegeria sp. SK021]
MFHSRTIMALVAALLASALSTPVAAQEQEKGTFDISVLGIRVGVLAFEATTQGDQYEARGSAKATGLMAALFDGGADVVATGRETGGTLKPSTFKEVTNSKKGRVERAFHYRNGIPEITRTPARSKPQKYAAPAAEQAGTVDPMTAAYMILRNQSAQDVCKMNVELFDGNRRSRLTMSSKSGSGDEITCTGTYRRIAGFSPKEMAERSSWPVSMNYERMGKDQYALSSAEFSTDFGTARLSRR